jgi:hypothetical protein
MKDTDLAKLCRARSRAHFALKQAETLAQGYRDKVADLKARFQAIAPDLQLLARLREPNPIFARGELRKLAIDMLREAGRPLAIRDMALGALTAKGVRFPDRQTTKRTRVRLGRCSLSFRPGAWRGQWGAGAGRRPSGRWYEKWERARGIHWLTRARSE